ncbi:hypothetical protein [Prevotella sp. HJM029]|uniref:hypothetical protein n=1 Tax=Prevotella sp. HJM029 TaxID=1433844 RepID=UPI0012DF0ED5|nr:hypothetical protein [Prevotella sp. HJM029]
MIKVASRASANMPFYIRMIGHGIANLPSTYLHPRDGIFANVHPSTLCVMTFALWHMCLRMPDYVVCPTATRFYFR